jgi:hypothetical protein
VWGKNEFNTARYKTMGQGESKDQELCIQALKVILKIRGRRVRSLQLTQILDFVQDTFLWFLEEGTVNLETWNKVGDRLRAHYVAEELECLHIFYFCFVVFD